MSLNPSVSRRGLFRNYFLSALATTVATTTAGSLFLDAHANPSSSDTLPSFLDERDTSPARDPVHILFRDLTSLWSGAPVKYLNQEFLKEIYDVNNLNQLSIDALTPFAITVVDWFNKNGDDTPNVHIPGPDMLRAYGAALTDKHIPKDQRQKIAQALLPLSRPPQNGDFRDVLYTLLEKAAQGGSDIELKQILATKVSQAHYFDPKKTAHYYKLEVARALPRLQEVLPILMDIAQATEFNVADLAAIYYRESSAGVYKDQHDSSARGAMQLTEDTYTEAAHNLPKELMDIVKRHAPKEAQIIEAFNNHAPKENPKLHQRFLNTRENKAVSFVLGAANLRKAYLASQRSSVPLEAKDADLVYVYGLTGALSTKVAVNNNPETPITEIIKPRALTNNHIPTQRGAAPSALEFYQFYTQSQVILTQEIKRQLNLREPQAVARATIRPSFTPG